MNHWPGTGASLRRIAEMQCLKRADGGCALLICTSAICFFFSSCNAPKRPYFILIVTEKMRASMEAVLVEFEWCKVTLEAFLATDGRSLKPDDRWPDSTEDCICTSVRLSCPIGLLHLIRNFSHYLFIKKLVRMHFLVALSPPRCH